MTTQERHQLANEGGTIIITGRKYRIVGDIFVFTGYFIGLAYLMLLYLLAFSLAEGMVVFWEILVLPSWPWLLAAFLSIGVGCMLILVDASNRKHKQEPKMEPEAARRELLPPHVHTPVEQPVEM
jgi:hypothetical protein